MSRDLPIITDDGVNKARDEAANRLGAMLTTMCRAVKPETHRSDRHWRRIRCRWWNDSGNQERVREQGEMSSSEVPRWFRDAVLAKHH
jgi:hypothetical protein